jgi:Family of unknown function (DUF6098)
LITQRAMSEAVRGSGLVAPGDWAESGLPVVDDFAELVRLVTERPGLMLRYSKGPDHDARSGPSRDYEADVDLPGLSATTIGPEPWWTRPAADWVARRVCKYADLGDEQDRYPWLLTGAVVGQGPDHEPLVVEVQPVARIGNTALNQAQDTYRRRFDVGQDSR